MTRFHPILASFIGLLFCLAPAQAQDSLWKECEASRRSPERSIAACSQIIARKDAGARAGAFHNRGLAFLAKGDLDQALADLSEGIRLDPKPAFRFHERGEAYLRKGDHMRAIADLTEAIRIDPTRAFRFHSRANAFLAGGDLERALADFSEAIRIDPSRPFRFHSRANLYRDLGRYDKALTDYDAVLRLEPSNAGALMDRGLVRAASGETRLALQDLDAAIALDPANPDMQAARARIAAPPAAQSPAERQVGSAPAPLPDSAQEATALAQDAHVRVALVIGNGQYANVPALPNPRQDAAAIAQSLHEAGFRTVQVERDLGSEAMRRVLRDFSAQAEAADWAVIYYAGHGIEIGGQNYLVPIDARLKSDRDVQFEAMPLEQVLTSISGAKKLRLVILDACRDNPFAQQMSRSVASRSIGRGLGRIEPDGGTLVAYAAKHGQTALDGQGQNSPFVSALVKHMATPGVEIRRLFGLVRDDVLSSTARQQEPFIYGSLGGEEFFFKAATARPRVKG